MTCGPRWASTALIVDVRGNRGGHTSQLIVEKLARRIIGWKVPRRLRPYSYPQDAPRGPLVALTDEFAGSDGDIVTAAIRSLGLGPVIGARTWGGVVGIDGHGHEPGRRHPDHRPEVRDLVQRVRLVGRELRRRPRHRGADHPRRLGRSAATRSSRSAVDRALAMLAENPPAPLPDPSTGPVKRRPPLPPRP